MIKLFPILLCSILLSAEMEVDAWPLQQQYLKEQHNFEWEYDRLWHLMISQCSDDEFLD